MVKVVDTGQFVEWGSVCAEGLNIPDISHYRGIYPSLRMRTFLHRERENKNGKYTISPNKAPSTPTQSKEYSNQNIRSTISNTTLIYAVLFVEFTQFVGIQLSGLNMRWHTKNYRYGIETGGTSQEGIIYVS